MQSIEETIEKLIFRLKKKLESMHVRSRDLMTETFFSSGTRSYLDSLEADIKEIIKVKDAMLDVFPFREGNFYSSDMQEYNREIKGRYDEKANELLFELPDGLPHRMTFDASTKKMRHAYNRAAVEKNYMDAIQKVKTESNLSLWPGKALVSITVYYDADSAVLLPDADNIDTKPFIDAIVKCRLLYDDNLTHVSCYITGVECQEGEIPQTIISVKLY